MNVIETLYFLIKGDATDLKKQMQEGKKDTDKLEESLKKTESASQKVGSSFIDMANSLTRLIVAGVSVGAIAAGIKEASDYAYQLDLASKSLNVNAEQLDAWGNAVRHTGGSVQGFESSLQSLSQHLGVTGNTALKLLPQLADALHRMGTFRGMQYGKMIGLDTPTILLLQQGRREVEAVIARQKELGTVTKQDREISEKFNVALQDTGHAMRSVFLAVGQTVLPILTKLLDAFIPVAIYLRRHSDLIVGGLLAIGAAATVAAFGLGLVTAQAVLITVGIGLFIAAVGIAYEDIQAFRHGHNSLIGDILKKWPIVGEVIKGVLNSLLAPFKALLEVIHLVSTAFDKVSTFFSGSKSNIIADLRTGQNALSLASSTPLAARTSNSIFNGGGLSKQQSINIGDVTINTQATDAVGIGNAFSKGIFEQFSQATGNFDDGVMA